jgi:hypothetical protein
VEKDNTGTNFSNTEDLCGSGVAYSGSGVTVEVTITGITDAAEYHWQARVKDAASAYSSWVSYGGNSDVITAARDFGVDTTAPTGGTAYDGTSGDQNYNDGSLTELSGNWTGFSSGASGLNKYQYALRRASDNYYWNTGSNTWQAGSSYVDNGTTTTATDTAMNLQTSTGYYVSVIAVDNAGNSSSPVSSDGQYVLETLSFSAGVSSVTFANLNNTNSWTDTQSSTLSTSTNASNGYSIKAYTSALFADITDAGNTVSNYSGTWAVPTTWSGGTYGFGYTSSDTSVEGSNRFLGATKFAGFTQSAPGDTVADHTDAVNGTTGAVVNEQFTVTYKAAVSPTQTAATYKTFVTYIVSANF